MGTFVASKNSVNAISEHTRRLGIIKMRLADVLTASRIIASPIVVWLILTDRSDAAYYLFAAAALTDLLDGYVARMSTRTASYGATFDGLADFILVYPVILAIAVKGHGFWLLVAGLVLIAVLIPVIALISRKQGALTIPHIDTLILAAFIYPTIMGYIVDWKYAEILLLVGFLVALYTWRNYVSYLRGK
jgi:phosphatidylglycerophosphate synthase